MVNFVATYRFTITESAVSSGAYFFLALNNPYDVQTAVGGPSPMGFSAMSTYYNKYRCNRTRVHVEAFAGGSAGTVVEACLVPAPTNSTLPSSPENWSSSYHAVSQRTTSVTSASGASKISLDKTWNMWDLFGITRSKYEAEDNYAAVYNGNPVNTMYCGVTAYGWNGGTAASLSGRYTVSFDVLLYSPTPQNP